MGFSRQEHWSGLPCPSLEDLPNPGIELASAAASAGRFFLQETWIPPSWQELPLNAVFRADLLGTWF